MGLMGLLVDIGSLLADCGGGSTVTLVGRHEPDVAVPMPVHVPVDKGHHPL